MIQRIQSVYMLFAAIAIAAIVSYVPVLKSSDSSVFIADFMIGQIAAFIALFLCLYSIFQFKNRSKQLFLNQLAKLALSIAFFSVFIQRAELEPDKGLFLFALPYFLLIIANYFIKKDNKLVQSADRIR